MDLLVARNTDLCTTAQIADRLVPAKGLLACWMDLPLGSKSKLPVPPPELVPVFVGVTGLTPDMQQLFACAPGVADFSQHRAFDLTYVQDLH